MQTKQTETHSPTHPTHAETITKPIQASKPHYTTPTRIPMWASVWGDHPPANLQAKLTVNQPGDIYEQEADRIANQVMRMPNPLTTIQRKCACGGTLGPTGECEECAKKRVALQRKSASDTMTPSIVNSVLSSGGMPLDASTRSFMEPRFGQDFSGVRIHTDQQATESAQAVNALAYTVGSDVVFGAGQYRPGTNEGRKLLAHELTHVVQQGGTARSLGIISDVGVMTRPYGLVQRQSDGGKSKHSGIEGGAVGSLQFCVNFCTGGYRITGWIWTGVGRRFWGTFVGPSVMKEGTLYRGNSSALQILPCGECDPACKGSEGGWDLGVPLFKDIFKPNAGRQRLSLAGLECGALFIASSLCHGSLELICFLDVIQYLGPIGKAIEETLDKVKKWTKGVVSIEVKAGIDGGGTLEICRGKNGKPVIPGVEFCLGGFIELGVGLSTSKEDYQKAGTPQSEPSGTPSTPESPPSSPAPQSEPSTTPNQSTSGPAPDDLVS